jgi:hypothetical protein
MELGKGTVPDKGTVPGSLPLVHMGWDNCRQEMRSGMEAQSIGTV